MSKPSKNWLEWSVFAVSLVLVVATLGFLVWESVANHGGPPDVVVTLGEAQPSSGGYRVPVEVGNVGRSTAEDVLIPVLLDLPDGTREEGRLNIAFLPRDSKREGWVTFRGDPGRGKLSLGAIAFEVP